MKRLIVTILALIYIISTTGATIQMHYCMGKLVGSGLKLKHSQVCDNCGMATHQGNNGCCKNEYKKVKLENDQQTGKNAIQLMQLLSVAVFFPKIEFPLSNVSAIRKNCASNSPPRSCVTAVYIRNCSFLI